MANEFVIVVDATQAFRKLQRLDRALDERPLLGAIGNKVMGWANKQFETEGRHSGEPWEPLSPNTIAGRLQGSSARILQKTGRGKQSLSFRIVGGSVEFGTAVPYMRVHQTGSDPYTIKPKKSGGLLHFQVMGDKGPVHRVAKEVHHPGLPAREFLPDARDAKEMAVDLIEQQIREASR